MTPNILRDAGPNERRCIARHHQGFYTNLIVAAVYDIPSNLVSPARLKTPELYAPALQECIQQHPFMSAIIHDAGSNKPVYTRPQQLDLHNHVRIYPDEIAESATNASPYEENALLQRVFERIHNDPAFKFDSIESQPGWAIDVVILDTHQSTSYRRIFVSFTYSHSHGDGMSGAAFHRTFYNALQKSIQSKTHTTNLTIKCPDAKFPEQPDIASKMPISLSYLLLPALGTYLPRFITRLFSIPANVSGCDDQTWTGSKMFAAAEDSYPRAPTTIEILTIATPTLTQLLKLCKTNEIKLTSLLNQIIAQAFNSTFHSSSPSINTKQYTNFISVIPINLRRALKVLETTIGVYGGAAYQRHEIGSTTPTIDDDFWTTIRLHGQHLAQVASHTKNQPIGLLRFIANFPSWVRDQIGQSRDSSWELSNLGSFNPDFDDMKIGAGSGDDGDERVNIEQMYFSQPASAMGPPVAINTIAVKNGPLNVVLTWQPGALDLLKTDTETSQVRSVTEQERQFVLEIIASMKAKLEALAEMV